jgi:hypothetical protein
MVKRSRVKMRFGSFVDVSDDVVDSVGFSVSTSAAAAAAGSTAASASAASVNDKHMSGCCCCRCCCTTNASGTLAVLLLADGRTKARHVVAVKPVTTTSAASNDIGDCLHIFAVDLGDFAAGRFRYMLKVSVDRRHSTISSTVNRRCDVMD